MTDAEWPPFRVERTPQTGRAKRGGGGVPLSLDEFTDEQRYAQEPADQQTPETLFELNWSRQVIARSFAALERDYLRHGQARIFALLKPCLSHDGEAQSYAEIAAVIGRTEGAVKSAMLRLRQLFQQCLRAELLETVGRPSDVEEELLHLRAVLSQ